MVNEQDTEKGKEKNKDETEEDGGGELREMAFRSRQQALQMKAAKEEASEHALRFLAERKVSAAESALQSMNMEWDKSLKYHDRFEDGDETRLLEFKGSKEPKPQPFRDFHTMFKGEMERPPMGKYLCAFHNALQHNGGGHARICYGVHDRGSVCGVVFDDPQRQKDKIRLLFDQQVKDFYPALTTGRDCSLEFMQVLGAPLERDTDVAYVVIVSAYVLRRDPSAIELFWWRGDAYIRLEGGVSRITPQQIERHYRRKAYADMEEWLASQKSK